MQIIPTNEDNDDDDNDNDDDNDGDNDDDNDDDNNDDNHGDNYDDDDDDDTDQPKIPANDHLETGRRGEAETLSKRKSKISGRNIC